MYVPLKYKAHTVIAKKQQPEIKMKQLLRRKLMKRVGGQK